ncbi:MAG: Hint domain-containing protein [Myxococcales bacterium]|nr:Hint domain-containing protein [Myxococcales bacterium]
MMMRRWVMVMAVLAAGCGSDDSSGSGGTAGKDAGSGGSAGSAGSGGSGATAGTAGSGGLAGTGGGTAGSGGMSGSSGTAGSAGAAGGTASCDSTNCEWTCCGDQCVNTTNDFKNCGACGKACTGQNPFCDNGTCKPNPPCDSGTQCPGVALCCGGNCCAAGDICCDVPGPVVTGVACTKPTAEGSCPLGCKTCVCTSPDTPIATPSGERAIAELRVGDLVYSVDHGATVAVPIRAIHSQPARSHHVMHVVLDGGRTLDISPGHPTADGRRFGELRAGEALDGVGIRSVTLVPYPHSRTYDILPDSDSGTYFAAGALIGSTLQKGADPSQACSASTLPTSR